MAQGGILFSAFEPSGDAVAAAVIAELKRQRPELHIWAVGGPKMRGAGAEIIEDPTARAVMLADVAKAAWEHGQRVKRLKVWLSQQRVDVFVPVDSPAANWAICKIVRRTQPQATVVHLVAPQLWAWAPWRARKLRRLTDHVLCLLPFEPGWLGRRAIPATFVGHPLLDAAPQITFESPNGRPPRLALLPGSRKSELKSNWPTMLAAYQQLESAHPGLTGQVACIDSAAESLLRRLSHHWPSSLEVKLGQVACVLRYGDAALVVSGTATLDAVAAGTPMVVLYNTRRVLWALVGWWAITTRTFSLPNLISEALGWGRTCPELVPHYGQVPPVVAQLDRLLRDESARLAQKAAWQRIHRLYQQVCFAPASVAKILEVAEL